MPEILIPNELQSIEYYHEALTNLHSIESQLWNTHVPDSVLDAFLEYSHRTGIEQQRRAFIFAHELTIPYGSLPYPPNIVGFTNVFQEESPYPRHIEVEAPKNAYDRHPYVYFYPQEDVEQKLLSLWLKRDMSSLLITGLGLNYYEYHNNADFTGTRSFGFVIPDISSPLHSTKLWWFVGEEDKPCEVNRGFVSINRDGMSELTHRLEMAFKKGLHEQYTYWTRRSPRSYESVQTTSSPPLFQYDLNGARYQMEQRDRELEFLAHQAVSDRVDSAKWRRHMLGIDPTLTEQEINERISAERNNTNYYPQEDTLSRRSYYINNPPIDTDYASGAWKDD